MIEHLMSDPLVVVLPDDHPRASEGADASIDLADLADSTWVSGPPGRPSRIQLDDAAADEGFVPHVPFQTESYDVAQALSDAGVAVSLIPRLALNAQPSTHARRLTNGLVREIVAVLPTSIDHVPLATELLRGLEQMAAHEASRDAEVTCRSQSRSAQPMTHPLGGSWSRCRS